MTYEHCKNDFERRIIVLFVRMFANVYTHVV